MDVVDDIYQQRVNCQIKILYILASTKITNLIKLRDLKICILRSTFLLFLCSSKYNLFEFDILHVYRIYH
jgi:hypothetical protein